MELRLGQQISALALVLVLWASLLLRLPEDRLQSGQVAKAAFSIEMAESFRQGTAQGLYPLRRFSELEFEDASLWAEEFPVYTATLGTVGRWVFGSEVGSDPAVVSGMIILGRALTLLAIPLFLIGLFRWSLILGEGNPFFNPWIGLAVAGCFPVFRLYANHIMPDFWMLTAVVWAWRFASQKSWNRAFLLGGFACLIKFYAAFSLFSIALWWFWSGPKPRKKEFVILVLSILPVALYLADFLSHSIPNPILQYSSVKSSGNSHGHFASGSEWLSLKFYARMVTWLVVKNTGIVASVLATFGVLSLWRSSHRKGLACLMVGQVLYIFIFAASFYVHDYYGMQFALVTWVLALFGAARVYEKKGVIVLMILLMGLGTEGVLRTRSASRPTHFYPDARSVLLRSTSKGSRGILVGDRYLEAILYALEDRVTWRMPIGQWAQADFQSRFKSRLKSVDWVSLFRVDSDEQTMNLIRAEVSAAGFKKVLVQDLENATIEVWNSNSKL